MTNLLKTTILLAALAAVFIAIGGAMGGQSGVALAFVVALVMSLGAYWFSGDIALRMVGAREVSPAEAPELHRLVEELATLARTRKPRVAIIDSLSPNALATRRNTNHAAVAVTTGLLGILSRDELAGVLAHELGHVRNRDILISSIAATLAGATTILANVVQWSMIFGGLARSHDEEEDGGFGGLVGSLLLIVLAPIAAASYSRDREMATWIRAAAIDAHLHRNPESLARALERLEMACGLRPPPVNPATSHLFIVNPLEGLSFAGCSAPTRPSPSASAACARCSCAWWPPEIVEAADADAGRPTRTPSTTCARQNARLRLQAGT